MKNKLPIALSNRHVHISKDDLEVLFGEGYQLTPVKDLSQPGQFACEEKVDLVGPKRTIKGVRVLGPTRSQSQVEVSLTDGFTLGLELPVKGSGSLEGTPGVKLVGPNGEVELKEGLIAAARHIHMNEKDAEEFGVKDRQIVKIKTKGERGLTFKNVLVRVRNDFALEMHVDIEEGNAAGVKNFDLVEMIK